MVNSKPRKYVSHLFPLFYFECKTKIVMQVEHDDVYDNECHNANQNWWDKHEWKRTK